MRFLAIHDFIFYLIYIPFTYFLLFTYKNPPPILLAVDSYLKIDYIVNSLHFLFGSLKAAVIIHIHCDTCIRMPHDVLQRLYIHSCGCKQGNTQYALKYALTGAVLILLDALYYMLSPCSAENY